jgi:hypothetical protein
MTMATALMLGLITSFRSDYELWFGPSRCNASPVIMFEGQRSPREPEQFVLPSTYWDKLRRAAAQNGQVTEIHGLVSITYWDGTPRRFVGIALVKNRGWTDIAVNESDYVYSPTTAYRISCASQDAECVGNFEGNTSRVYPMEREGRGEVLCI